MSADPRLAKLLDAVLSVSGDLDLETVLQHVVRAACGLVDARYGALGVIDPDGDGLRAFVHHGVDDATAAAIGRPPEGRGVLGVLIRDPRPLRLADITTHPDAHGFPTGHPPMGSFLGTPIRIRDEVFGNLYLAEKRDGGAFTEHDEELVVGLAAVAGAAVQNARLFDEARRRDAWRDAVLEVSATALAGGSAAVVRDRVAELARHLLDADSACIVEPFDGGLWVLATDGHGPPAGFLAEEDGPATWTLHNGRPVRVERDPVLVRSGLWVPIRQGDETVAALGVGRRAPFLARDEQLLTAFSAQVSFAWTYERAQTDLQRLKLIEDRERIGRDLHDTVIQRLFATGLSLQAAIRRVGEHPEVTDRLERAVDDIDTTVKEIRSTIFALQSAADPSQGVRSRVLGVVEELAVLLPRTPRVRFDGPIDAVVGDRVSEHLYPVVREALTNVAKHADARDVEVELSVDGGGLVLRVTDDGRGIDPDAPRGFGINNMRDRAATLGGSFEIGSRGDGRGTALVFRVPSG